jgi:glycosyltransferase involved in cell wall biosynthesis
MRMTANLQADQKKPLITVVMAVYRPNEDWLKEQLQSLDRQSYQNLELIICDDCPDEPVEEAFFKRHIGKLPFRLLRNDRNMGSNKTFEKLTTEAGGQYIAYCDQDDIWEDGKIELLVRRLEATNAVLCYSDVSVIDGKGNKIADSITKLRRRHVFREGEALAPELLVRNYVMGCAMLVRTDIAKAAVPFENGMVHDHWLALYAALNGRLSFEPTATVLYRQHGSNQTGVLMGVATKDDYLNLRIKVFLARTDSLRKRLEEYDVIQQPLMKTIEWALSREAYFRRPSPRNLKRLWKLRDCGIAYTVFEAFIPIMPASLFKKVIRLLK